MFSGSRGIWSYLIQCLYSTPSHKVHADKLHVLLSLLILHVSPCTKLRISPQILVLPLYRKHTCVSILGLHGAQDMFIQQPSNHSFINIFIQEIPGYMVTVCKDCSRLGHTAVNKANKNPCSPGFLVSV